jgi:hypothetical protein
MLKRVVCPSNHRAGGINIRGNGEYIRHTKFQNLIQHEHTQHEHTSNENDNEELHQEEHQWLQRAEEGCVLWSSPDSGDTGNFGRQSDDNHRTSSRFVEE